ncbi:MAG: hypothetical protein QOH23_2374 [Gaiellaceae bacterium]|nr:hypothetical protein [Gaiellaceae bacterium]
MGPTARLSSSRLDADTNEAGQSPASWRYSEVADGTRTHDHLDHNQGLYQLSYSHRAGSG